MRCPFLQSGMSVFAIGSRPFLQSGMSVFAIAWNCIVLELHSSRNLHTSEPRKTGVPDVCVFSLRSFFFGGVIQP